MNSNTSYTPSEVKAGSTVAIHAHEAVDRAYPRQLILRTVERVTKTQAVLKSQKNLDDRFRLRDGIVVGSTFRKVFIPTEDQISAAKRQSRTRVTHKELTGWFDSIRQSKISVEQLSAMKEAYDSATPYDESLFNYMETQK